MKRSIARTGRSLVFAAAAALMALVAPAGAGATGYDGSGTVQSLYNALLAVMRNGPTLGPRGRYQQIEPVVQRSFDIPFMTRLAVGPDWAGLNDTQRQQVAQAFERYIAAIYAERFDSYSGQRLQVTGQKTSAGGLIITSQIVKSDGDPVNINYLMHDNGGVWQIADIYLDGTISELATRRSEFASILRASGIDGLIQALNTKAYALAGAS